MKEPTYASQELEKDVTAKVVELFEEIDNALFENENYPDLPGASKVKSSKEVPRRVSDLEEKVSIPEVTF